MGVHFDDRYGSSSSSHTRRCGIDSKHNQELCWTEQRKPQRATRRGALPRGRAHQVRHVVVLSSAWRRAATRCWPLRVQGLAGFLGRLGSTKPYASSDLALSPRTVMSLFCSASPTIDTGALATLSRMACSRNHSLCARRRARSAKLTHRQLFYGGPYSSFSSVDVSAPTTN